jgi:hypothetical protein
MIQLNLDNSSTYTLHSVYADIYDFYNPTTYSPLFSFKSQQTGSIKNFIPSLTNLDKVPRYVLTQFFTTNDKTNENLTGGFVFFGDNQYPYDLYDYTIYRNINATNLDPIYTMGTLDKGVVNITSSVNNVEYKEYAEPSDVYDSVYITNPI